MEKPDHQLFHCRCVIAYRLLEIFVRSSLRRIILEKYDRMDATRKHPILNLEYGYCNNELSRSERSDSFRVN